ncbi:MAG: hypothetical protein R3Y35_01360 [Clostridia bacterium]
MKILKNNKGSTLFITIIFIFVVSLMLVGFHTTVFALMTKVSVTYDDKESYLSARSVAVTVAEYIEDLYDDEVERLENLSSNTSNSFDVESANAFLLALEDLAEGDTLELTDISFNSDDTDFTLGEIYKAYITKTASGLLISVESTVDGAVEEIAISLNSEVVEIEVNSKTSSSVQITGGYLRGFYLDIMPYCSCLTYAEDENDDDGAMLCVDSSFIYVNEDSYLGMKADFYCHSDVILVGAGDNDKSINGTDYEEYTDDNIEFFAEGYIYLNSISVKYADLQSEKAIYITNENNSESLTISNVNINCDTLYIDATGSKTIKFTDVSITANNVIVYCEKTSSISSYLTFSGCSITTNNINYYKAVGSTNDNSKLDEYFDDQDNDELKITTNRTYTATDLVLPARNIPSFVSAANQLDTITVSNDSYIFTAAAATTADFTYQVYELSSSKSSYTFSSTNFADGYSDETPIVVVVPDGVDVTLSNRISTNGVYFYLKGSATLTCSEELDYTIRVYSEAVTDIDGFNNSALIKIDSSLSISSTVVTLAQKIEDKSESSLKSSQTNIFTLINTIQNSYGSLITENGIEINGTVTCAVIKNIDPTETDDDKGETKYSGIEMEYEYTDSLASQTIDSSDWSTFVENYYTFSVDVFTKEE